MSAYKNGIPRKGGFRLPRLFAADFAGACPVKPAERSSFVASLRWHYPNQVRSRETPSSQPSFENSLARHSIDPGRGLVKPLTGGDRNGGFSKKVSPAFYTMLVLSFAMDRYNSTRVHRRGI